ncbi:hypothetical protein SHEWT2_01193 [Shewanella hafniensis]|jgi:hypothetical protein|nr:hypothetical protein SHEWT2_01193 [Shewanella hafniensis]
MKEFLLMALPSLVILAVWHLLIIIKKRGGLFVDDQPDSEQVFIDAQGVKWFKYGVEYIDGRSKTMSFHIWATSFDDANHRLKLIGNSGRVYGQVFCEIKE